jgi:ribosomal protein L19E
VEIARRWLLREFCIMGSERQEEEVEVERQPTTTRSQGRRKKREATKKQTAQPKSGRRNGATQLTTRHNDST